MTLRSVTSRMTSALVGVSPGKAMAGEARPIDVAPPFADGQQHLAVKDGKNPSILANAENGPEAGTFAMLMRQSKSLTVASGGEIATSVVIPPPFFHGICRWLAGTQDAHQPRMPGRLRPFSLAHSMAIS